MTEISFVIVNYNSLDFIKNLLESFKLIDEDQDDFFYEIIIFDNASSDGSIRYIEEKALTRKNIKLIKSDQNVGFCRGSNLAANSACGKYLVFLNPDTRILEGNITSLVDFLKGREAAGEKVGITGVKTINYDETLQYSSRAFPSISRQFFESFFLFKIFRKSKYLGSYFMTWWDHKNIMESDWVSGSFMFVKKEIFNQLN
ncbi:MAG: glycosyltransferase [Actinomycetota bacterium]